MQICTHLHGLPGGIKTRLDNLAINVDALDKKGFHCQNSLWAVIAFIEANFKPLVTERDRYHKKLPNICAEQPLLLDHPFVSTPIPQDRKHRPCFAYRLLADNVKCPDRPKGICECKKNCGFSPYLRWCCYYRAVWAEIAGQPLRPWHQISEPISSMPISLPPPTSFMLVLRLIQIILSFPAIQANQR